MNRRKAIFMGAALSLAVTTNHASQLGNSQYRVYGHLAQVTTAGTTLILSNLPVLDTNNGRTSYFEMEFEMQLSGNGVIYQLAEPISMTPAPAPALMQPGTYQDSDDQCYRLSNPTALEGGRLQYTISGTTEGEGCATEKGSFSATVVTGPAVGNPDIHGRPVVEELPGTWAYGVVASRSQFRTGGLFSTDWITGGIVGLRAGDNTLTVAAFHVTCCGNNDRSTIIQSAVLNRINPAN